MSFQSVTVVDSVSVDASTTNEPVAVDVGGNLNEVIVYIVNEGNSTNLTVTVYSSPDGTIKSPIQPLTLNTTTTTGHVEISKVPAYLVFVAANGDSSNATTYSVIISKRV